MIRNLRLPRWYHWRVWIVATEDTALASHRDVPSGRVRVVMLAEPTFMSARQARLYLEGFNSAALKRRLESPKWKHWAVAFPIRFVCAGEPRLGELLELSTNNSPW